MAIIPGGRGRKIGPDAIVTQNESYESRAAQIPKFGAWGWSCLGDLPYTYSHGAGTVGGANTTYLALMPQLTKKVAVRYARARITVNSAGNFLRTALYLLDNTGIFRKIAASDATFPTDNTGVQTITLQREIVLNPTSYMFFGFNATSINPSFSALPTNSTGVMPTLTRVETVTTMPNTIPRTSPLSTNTTGRIPLVAYLSTEAYQLF